MYNVCRWARRARARLCPPYELRSSADRYDSFRHCRVQTPHSFRISPNARGQRNAQESRMSGNEDVRRCLDKAAEMERRAKEARDGDSRNAYVRLAENWRFLAENHRRVATMDRGNSK